MVAKLLKLELLIPAIALTGSSHKIVLFRLALGIVSEILTERRGWWRCSAIRKRYRSRRAGRPSSK